MISIVTSVINDIIKIKYFKIIEKAHPHIRSMATVEYYAFNADIQQFIGLISNTIYFNKEIFLKELISNASDALDKIKYLSLTDPEISRLNLEPRFRIRIIPDKVNNTLTIQDTGIGMTKQELINNLGASPLSRTKRFMIKSLLSGADASMIGQFGVGFYSAYLVAGKVQVFSHSISDGQYVWESTADGGIFSVSEDTSRELITRGTKVVLHLKSSDLEFLEEKRLKETIMKHSEFISHPIELKVEKIIEKEVRNHNKELECEEITFEEEVDIKEEMEEEKEKEKEKKKVTEVTTEFEIVNKTKPLWMRAPEEVTMEESYTFYKSISNDWDGYLAMKHFSVVGQLEYRCLIFLPKRAPIDLLEIKEKKHGIKLYVRRAFIMDGCEELIPGWLSFIKGVVDSEDLPSNITRESLQYNKILKVIKKNIVKKCLELIAEVAENQVDYKKFYEQFGKNLKLGFQEDCINRSKIAELLRFYTSRSSDEMISLNEYISRMKPEQEEIYYTIGESMQAVVNSPFIKSIKKRGYEVVYMVDPIDECVIEHLREFDGKMLKNCIKASVELEQWEEEEKKFEEHKVAYESLCKLIKEVLGDKVEKVQVGKGISNSPCMLVASESGWSPGLERIMKVYASRDPSIYTHIISKKILEINPNHPIVSELKQKTDTDKYDKTVKDLIWLLFDNAALASGFPLSESVRANDEMTKFNLSAESNTADEKETIPDPVKDEKKEGEASKMEEID